MPDRTEWKLLSARTRALLDGEGDELVVVTDTPEDVTAELLAAIANAEGGTILVGVLEEPDEDGERIMGCGGDEDDRGPVIFAAADCDPPVPLEVLIENTSRAPILRLEVGSNGLHGTPEGTFPIWSQGEVMWMRTLDILVRGQQGGVGAVLKLQARQLAELTTEIELLRDQVEATEVAAQAAEGAAVGLDERLKTQEGRLAALESTADKTLRHTRALARHLGADNTLIEWEKRQLRTLMASAIEMTQKRGGRDRGDSDELKHQVKKTWSKVFDWVNDEVIDQLQKEAQEVLRAGEETGGEEDE